MKKILTILLSILLSMASFSFVSCDKLEEKTGISSTIFTHTVRFECNGGKQIENKEVNVLKNAPTTTKPDHVFDGWYLDRGLTTAAIFPLDVKRDITLYAKWLKVADQINCTGGSIKFWEGHSSSLTYYITPSGFETETLANKGYVLSIKVAYDVYYKKDYDVPFDIGYAGSPKYEVSIINSKTLLGCLENDLPTKKSVQRKTLTYTTKFVDIKNSSLILSFSTDNIQNLIYFYNITISYKCYKY